MSSKGNGHSRHHDLPQPSPDLPPEEVVRIVVSALQHNDDPCEDCGIQTTFNFASPANRAVTGPLPRFVEMVKNPLYGAMIDFARADFEPMVVLAEQAEQRVTLFGADGSHVTYVFALSRQPGPAFKGCWMTDGVMRVD